MPYQLLLLQVLQRQFVKGIMSRFRAVALQLMFGQMVLPMQLVLFQQVIQLIP